MGKQRPIFSVEFKHEAACLVLDQGYSISQACIYLTSLRASL